MNMSLYHIDQELENLIDQETGEVLDFDAFEALQMARDAKIEGVLCWTKNLAAEAKAIREEEKELAERRKAMESKREKLLAYAERARRGTQERRPDAPFETVRAAQGDGGAEMDGGGLSPRIWEKLFMRGDKRC